MQIKEAIVLAGGLGTRLRDAVPDLPKCMAPVAGRPFLFYVINYLRSQGIERFIFSLGYQHEVIEGWLASQFATLDYVCSVENEPLGTGGAILLACKQTTENNVFVVNGDTLFKANLAEMAIIHQDNAADTTLALKPMKNFDRYGTVEMNDDNSISSFHEKKFCSEGNINGGVYLLNVMSFTEAYWPSKFSFEKDYLESNNYRLFGYIDDSYFIDIGIPEDYHRAQEELKPSLLDLEKVDKTWTLLIDRDGVINREKKDEYILNWKEFQFYDGVKEAFSIFEKKFGRIIIISNQRGIGKGLMTEDDLTGIHKNMQAEIEALNGRIDKIYYCIETDNKHFCRKPNPGMAFLAKTDFPEIDFARSIMVGNKPSDMLFGRFAGIYTVFLTTTNPDQPLPHPDIDLSFGSLNDFAKAL